MFMRSLIVLAAVLLLVPQASASEYTLQTFQQQMMQASSPEEIAELCREYMTNADDIDVVRRVQTTWENTDTEGVRAFSKQQMNDNPGSAMHVYLYGRVAETPVEQVEIGRKAIELDPTFPYGYRLVTATYINFLFNANADGEFNDKLEAMLPDDRSAFEKLAEIDADQSYAHRFLWNYLVHAGEYADALAAMKSADVMLDDWPSEQDYAVTYAYLEDWQNARMMAEEVVDKAIEAGQIEAEQRDRMVGTYYVRALRLAERYDEAIKFVATYPGSETDPDVQYQLACLKSAAGDESGAIAALDRAAANGWYKVKTMSMDDDLKPLQDNDGWDAIITAVEANWDESRPERRKEALAQRISEDAPGWTLPGVDGGEVSLAGLKGNVVILDFWATWCGPCRMAMPEIDEFTEALNTDKVKVYSVNVWEQGSKEKPAQYMKENDYDMTLLFGDDDLAAAYSVQGIPHIVVIGPDGKIRYRHYGYEEGLGEVLSFWTEDLLGSPVTKVSSLN